MTAIAEARSKTTRHNGNCPINAGVKADEVIYQGTLAGLADGLAVADETTSNYLCAGRAMQSRDATTLADSDLFVDIEEGTFEWESSGIAADDVGKIVYVVDNQTVSLDSSSGARPVAGILRRYSSTEGTFVESSLALSQALTSVVAGAAAGAAAIASALAKRTVTIGHADLTDAVNGEAQVINVGAVLPANAVVLAHEVNVATLFSGGSVSAVTLEVGGTDADAIVDGMDVFTGAATGALTGGAGVHPKGKFSAQQLTATFTPDGGHALLALTAGSLTITVWYSVLA